MRISFDLDDTLVLHREDAPVELEEPKVGIFQWGLYREKLREGAIRMLTELSVEGWELWIYTSSSRSERKVKAWMAGYGVRLSGVVNYDTHIKKMAQQGIQSPPSKLPRLFGIDLHVDDSLGVEIEGHHFKFHTLIIDPWDADWTDKVLKAAREFKEKRQAEERRKDSSFPGSKPSRKAG